MSTSEIAHDLVKMWNAGQFHESGVKYWADGVVSVEAMEGPMRTVTGKAAVIGKSEWWANAHEVHGAEVEGPYVNGDQFVIRLKMDVTVKESGDRRQLDEMCLYTIKGGKISEEVFFYGS